MYTVFSKYDCHYCEQAKDLLYERFQDFQEFNLDDPENLVFLRMMKDLGHLTVPQVYDPSGYHIGGYNELEEYLDEICP